MILDLARDEGGVGVSLRNRSKTASHWVVLPNEDPMSAQQPEIALYAVRGSKGGAPCMEPLSPAKSCGTTFDTSVEDRARKLGPGQAVKLGTLPVRRPLGGDALWATYTLTAPCSAEAGAQTGSATAHPVCSQRPLLVTSDLVAAKAGGK